MNKMIEQIIVISKIFTFQIYENAIHSLEQIPTGVVQSKKKLCGGGVKCCQRSDFKGHCPFFKWLQICIERKKYYKIQNYERKD